MNATSMRSASAAPAAPNGVSALTAVATPTAPDKPPEHDTTAARRFADLLHDRQRASAAAEQAPAHARATTSSSTGNTRASSAADRAVVASEAGDGAASPTRTSPPSHAPTAKNATAKAEVDEARHDPGTSPSADSDEDGDDGRRAPTSTGERAAALAALAAAHAAPRSDAAATAAALQGAHDRVGATNTNDGNDHDAGSVVAGRSEPGLPAARALSVETSTSASDRELQSAAASTSLATDTGVGAAFAGRLGAAATPSTAAATGAGDAVAASLLAAGSAPAADGAGATASAPAAIALPTPIDAPEFASALGIQVSLLAQDGVQHAELHLHPVETGPVSVSIAIDGTSARIDFGADSAATRHAIEQGLPELASALRDAGLTLTGGGVSQHAASGGDAGGGRSRERGGHGTEAVSERAIAAADAAIVVRRIRASGVDLYA